MHRVIPKLGGISQFRGGTKFVNLKTRLTMKLSGRQNTGTEMI